MSIEEKESSSSSKVHPSFRQVHHHSFLSSLVKRPFCSLCCSLMKKNHPPRQKTNSIFVLVVAIVSASTAGVIFKILEGEPLYNKGGEKGEEEKVAALLASSRLTATALVQLPIFLCSLLFRSSSSSSSSSSPKKKTLRGEERKRTRTTIRDENNEEDARYLRENLHVFVLSGFFLSLHFYFWMNGLVRTSLSHSLLFVTSSPIAYVCLTAMTFRSEKVQKVIVWVVSKKNRQQQQQKKNTVGDEDNNETRETGANGGEIELHEYNVEEGKKEEEEEENENVNDDDDDEFTELYTVPPSSSVSSSSSILRFKDVSSFEFIGAIIGFVGSCIIAFDATNKNGSSNSSSSNSISSSSSSSSSQRNDRPSLKGDVLSLLSAILVCGYIAIGAKIRGDRPSMPIFVYSFPIVASAAIFLQIVVVLTCAFDDDGGFKPTVFLESYRWMRFWDPAVGQKTCFLVFFLAVVPGTLGHSGFFVAMKHLSSLTVTFALSFEPIIGSAIGYLLSVSSIPGPATFVGGFVLLVGVYCCNL